MHRNLLKRLGRNVKSRRVALGWTQEALAGRAGIHDREVSQIELGNRNITMETLYKLSDALSVNPAEILND